MASLWVLYRVAKQIARENEERYRRMSLEGHPDAEVLYQQNVRTVNRMWAEYRERGGKRNA